MTGSGGSSGSDKLIFRFSAERPASSIGEPDPTAMLEAGPGWSSENGLPDLRHFRGRSALCLDWDGDGRHDLLLLGLQRPPPPELEDQPRPGRRLLDRGAAHVSLLAPAQGRNLLLLNRLPCPIAEHSVACNSTSVASPSIGGGLSFLVSPLSIRSRTLRILPPLPAAGEREPGGRPFLLGDGGWMPWPQAMPHGLAYPGSSSNGTGGAMEVGGWWEAPGRCLLRCRFWYMNEGKGYCCVHSTEFGGAPVADLPRRLLPHSKGRSPPIITGSVSAADYDNDGDVDLLLVGFEREYAHQLPSTLSSLRSSRPPTLLENLSGRRWRDLTKQAGLTPPLAGLAEAVAHGDLDAEYRRTPLPYCH